MSKTKFTEVYIKNLPIKEKAYNKSEDNLRIRVYPTGTKSWSFYKTDLTGNRKPQKLGTYPDISLAKAKQMSSIQSANIYTTGHGIETSVKGISYKDNVLIVKNLQGQEITLDNEPDSDMFKQGLYLKWRDWDTKYGINDSDRTDYEPWAHNSLKSLAMELGLIQNKGHIYFTSYFQELHS